MKLNKNGWGTMEMLLLSGGLLIALLVAIFFISRLYGSLDNAVGNKAYGDLEIALENAARNYVENNNVDVTEEYKITSESLINSGYLSNFNDPKGKKCYGYVLISRVDNINTYAGYISCNEYTTRNYK